jgi:hypothetical protein
MATTLVLRYLWRGIWRANANQILVAFQRSLALQAKLPPLASPYIPLTATVTGINTVQDIWNYVESWAATTLETLASQQSTTTVRPGEARPLHAPAAPSKIPPEPGGATVTPPTHKNPDVASSAPKPGSAATGR